MSSDSTQIVHKERLAITKPEDHITHEEVFIEDSVPQTIETVKPVSIVHITPQKKSVSTNTPSIPSVLPYIHEPSMRSVIQHPLSLTQDDSNFRKIDLDSSSPGDCHTPPLQVTGYSSFLRNSETFESLRSVTPDSELSPSTNRVDN